jgi:hypothetical protein
MLKQRMRVGKHQITHYSHQRTRYTHLIVGCYSSACLGVTWQQLCRSQQRPHLTHTHTNTHTHTHMYIYIIHTCVCVCVTAGSSGHTHTHVHTHTYTHNTHLVDTLLIPARSVQQGAIGRARQRQQLPPILAYIQKKILNSQCPSTFIVGEYIY